jgi:hypothetical protein
MKHTSEQLLLLNILIIHYNLSYNNTNEELETPK